MAQTVKNPPAMQETWVRNPGQENPLEKGMATHSSSLACRITWTEEPGGLQSMRSQRVRHNWTTNTTTNIMEKNLKKIYTYIYIYGLPRWLSGKESACQSRRWGFNPWVRKILWKRPWQLTPVFLPGKSMDRGAWWVTIHGVTKELDTTEQLNNNWIVTKCHKLGGLK